MSKQRLSFSVKSDLHKWYKETAEDKGVSMAALMNIALEQYMDMQEGLRVMRNREQMQQLMDSIDNIRQLLNVKHEEGEES